LLKLGFGYEETPKTMSADVRLWLFADQIGHAAERRLHSRKQVSRDGNWVDL